MSTIFTFSKIKRTAVAIVAVLFVLASKPTKAQGIIYVDCEPDITVICNHFDPEGFDIDLDNDGVNDARAYLYVHSAGFYCYILETYNDWKLLPMTDIEPIPTAPGGWIEYFMWDSLRKSKFGFKHKIGDDYYYAWARIKPNYSDDIGGSLTLYEYAYCTIPNYPLVWGQTSIDAIEENRVTESQLSVFPNPSGDMVNIRFADNETSEINCVSVFDISGRIIMTQSNSFENVDISGFAPGVYVMKVILQNGKTFEEKIVKN